MGLSKSSTYILNSIEKKGDLHFISYDVDFVFSPKKSHFTRIRWPAVDGKGYYTIEQIGLHLIKESNLNTEGIERVAITDFLSSRSVQKWKKYHGQLYKKLERRVMAVRGRGLPDFVQYDSSSKQLIFWEIKSPFDNISKQKNLFSYVTKHLSIRCNVVNFDFKDKSYKGYFKKFRQEYRLKIEKECLLFSESSAGVKIIKLANKHFINSYRASAQSYLVNGEVANDSSAELSVYPSKFLKSGYETQRILYEHSDKLNFSSAEVVAITKHLLAIGYYKWWVTPFMFKSNKTLNSKAFMGIVIECVKFEKDYLTIFEKNQQGYLSKVIKSLNNGNDLKKNKSFLLKIESYMWNQFVGW